MKVLRTIVLSIGFAALATACGGSAKDESTTPAAETTEPAGDMGGDMGGDDMGGDDMGGDDMGDDMGNPCGDMDNPCGDMGDDEGDW
jgi:hypothetical protein